MFETIGNFFRALNILINMFTKAVNATDKLVSVAEEHANIFHDAEITKLRESETPAMTAMREARAALTAEASAKPAKRIAKS